MVGCDPGALRLGENAPANTGSDPLEPLASDADDPPGQRRASPSADAGVPSVADAEPPIVVAPRPSPPRPSADAGVPAPRPDSRPAPTPDSRPAPTPDSAPAPTPDSAPAPRPDTNINPGECSIFPADDPWNIDISNYPVHANSAGIVAATGGSKPLHPDFGTVWNGAPNGIPFVAVSGSQAPVPIRFTAYGDESDPGPYPIPSDAPIEGGPDGTADRHVIALDVDNCMLYELYRAFPDGSGWRADSGAVFDLSRDSQQRPIGWTSADAAGLPIYPGLVRYDEVASGEIRHALRVTFVRTRRAFVAPASHYASTNTDPDLPPMGLRMRLKSSFNITGFSAANQVILRALKKYGMLVADNGGDWFISGAPDSRWSDDELNQLKTITGSAFEVVDTGPIRTSY